MTLQVLDATGTKQNLSTTNDATGAALVGSTCIADPATGQKAQVAVFHNGDGQSLGTVYGILTGGVEMAFNGTSLDRWRTNMDTGALVTLSAASAGGNSADQTNYNGRGLQLGINITALAGTTPTLTVTIQGKDTSSGQYYTLLQSAALNATGYTNLTVYPGAPVTANVSATQVLPRTWRILYAIGGSAGQAVTATIGASVIN